MPESTLSPFRRTELAARRRKIARACDFCREQRVRCEAVAPCPQCVANNVACHRSRPSITPRKRNWTRSSEGAERPPPGEALVDATSIDDSQSVEASAQTPSPEENLAWTSHQTDSMLGFIARINAFCSGISQLSPGPTPPGRDPSSRGQVSPLSSGAPKETHVEDCDLSATQTDNLLRIFWSRLRPQLPIVGWEDLKSNEQAHGAPSPLLDAVTAYSLRRIYYSRLHTRLVGLNWPQFQRSDPEIGMSYFRRSLSAVTQVATFAGPSVSAMQCYCYLISYLLDAGQHQAAYNMVGLALRISQSLNYMDARTGGYRECQLFRRIWWTLIHLDFRCSRHVGKPVTTQVEELLCMRPRREPQDIYISNGLLYHTESIRLTAAALLVNAAMDRFSQAARSPDIEARAQNLSDHIVYLQKWRNEMPKEQSFAHIQLDVPDVPDAPVDLSEAGFQDDQMEQSTIETLLSTLLILQYHNAIISLHRVFIQFPSHPLIPKSNPKADTHATTALNHALMMIRIAHQRMAMHEIFHGLSEIYQYQWNAVITIIGFMLAYPYCHRCSRAREYLNLALEVFDSVDSENTIARRAATMTRHLCSKVDMLTRTLDAGQPTPDTLSPSGPTTQSQSLQNSSADLIWPSSQNEEAALQGTNEDSLWSWADLINLDAWPSYCDEVSEAFMNPADFSILHSL